MTPEQEAKCREAFEAWLLNGNRFCCEPKDIFTAGYQAAWSAAQPHGVEDEGVDLEKGARAIFASSGLGTAYWEQANKQPFLEKARACYEANNIKVKE